MPLAWHRIPFHLPGTGRAHYALRDDAGELVGWLRWCGHPTATYPYFTDDDAGKLRTFRNVKDGKAFVEAMVAARQAEATE